ncbi:hypothetical protein BOS5A_230992 [Bosea sp. EC-HK365B]|nr:hypothetical protein BOS5A_230992 [Bosea sp. EC-HK365B]
MCETAPHRARSDQLAMQADRKSVLYLLVGDGFTDQIDSIWSDPALARGQAHSSRLASPST